MSGEVVRCAVCDNQMFAVTPACVVCGTPNPYAHLAANPAQPAQPPDDAPHLAGRAEASLQPDSASTPFDLDLIFPTAPSEPMQSSTGSAEASPTSSGDLFALDLSSLFAWDDTPASDAQAEALETQQPVSTSLDEPLSLFAEAEPEPEPELATSVEADYISADVAAKPAGELLPPDTADAGAGDIVTMRASDEPADTSPEYTESDLPEAFVEEASHAISSPDRVVVGDLSAQPAPASVELEDVALRSDAPLIGDADVARVIAVGEESVVADDEIEDRARDASGNGEDGASDELLEAEIVDFDIEPEMVSGEVVDYEVNPVEVGGNERPDTDLAPAEEANSAPDTTVAQPPHEESYGPDKPELPAIEALAPVQDLSLIPLGEPSVAEIEPEPSFGGVPPLIPSEEDEIISLEPDVQTAAESAVAAQVEPEALAVEDDAAVSADEGDGTAPGQEFDQAIESTDNLEIAGLVASIATLPEPQAEELFSLDEGAGPEMTVVVSQEEAVTEDIAVGQGRIVEASVTNEGEIEAADALEAATSVPPGELSEPDVLQPDGEADSDKANTPEIAAVEIVEPVEIEVGADDALGEAVSDTIGKEEVTLEVAPETASESDLPIEPAGVAVGDVVDEAIAPVVPAELEMVEVSEIDVQEEPSDAVASVEPGASGGEVGAEEELARTASEIEQPEPDSSVEVAALDDQLQPSLTTGKGDEPSVDSVGMDSTAYVEAAQAAYSNSAEPATISLTTDPPTALVDSLAVVEQLSMLPLEDISRGEDYGTASMVETAAPAEATLDYPVTDPDYIVPIGTIEHSEHSEHSEYEPDVYPAQAFPELLPPVAEEAPLVLPDEPFAPEPYEPLYGEPSQVPLSVDWSLPTFEEDDYSPVPEGTPSAPEANEAESSNLIPEPPAPDYRPAFRQFIKLEDIAVEEYAAPVSEQVESMLDYAWSPDMEVPPAVPVELPQDTYSPGIEVQASQPEEPSFVPSAEEQPEPVAELEAASEPEPFYIQTVTASDQPAASPQTSYEESGKDDLYAWKPGDDMATETTLSVPDVLPNGSIYYNQTTPSALSPDTASAYTPSAQPAWDPSTPRPKPGTPEYDAMVQQALAARGLRTGGQPGQPARPSEPAFTSPPSGAISATASEPAWSPGMPKPKPGTPEYEAMARQALSQRFSGQGADVGSGAPQPTTPYPAAPAPDPTAPRPQPGTPEYEELVRRALAQKFNKQS